MKEIVLPQVDVNSESATIMKWFFKEKDFVKTGEVICEIETTKTVIAIEAEVDGFLTIIIPEKQEIEFNKTIGYLFNDVKEYESFKKSHITIEQSKKEHSATKKALQIAQQYDVDLSIIHKDGIISVILIYSFSIQVISKTLLKKYYKYMRIMIL